MGRERWILAAIVACYVALYIRAIDHDFVWDDVAEIARAPSFDEPLLDGLRMTQVERIDPVLAHSEGVVLAYDSYRPLLFASYWLEIRIWGRRPGPMHADNLAIGAVGILLAHRLARRLVSARTALAATAIFALHPICVEAVAYISGRGDLLAGVLAIATALLALHASEAQSGPRRLGWIAAAAAGFALSLLAKESCVALPLALVAMRASRRDLVMPIVLAAVAAGVLALRAMLISTSSDLALGDAIARLPAVYLDDARAVLLPFDLSTDRPLVAAHVAPGWALAAAAVAAAVIALVRRGWPAQLPAAIVGLVWWIVLAAPSSVAILSTGVVSDRYMYAPLLGLAIALVAGAAAIVQRRPALRRPVLAAAAAWAVLVGVVAWRQVAVWSSDLALDTHAIAAAPESGAAHWRLGNVHAIAGRWDAAIAELQIATELDPANFHALGNLGVALIRTQRYPEAEDVLVRAVAASPAPSRFRPLFNLGVARLALGKRDEGCAAIRQALAIRPGYTAAAEELARSCQR